MKKATYTNRITKETYILAGVSNIEKAWNLTEYVCKRMNWNHDMIHSDVVIKIS